MKKTKIEWCDSTWNPVTGCLHGCTYCYARRMAERFGSIVKEDIEEYRSQQIHVVDEKKHCLYPYVFEPTLHKYRFDEPARMTKPRNIFVCSMADLFGDWVPDEWIYDIMSACEKAPQHNYLFLTKQPKNYIKLTNMVDHENKDDHSNWWWGTTVTNTMDMLDRAFDLWMFNYGYGCGYDSTRVNRFLSIEPLHGPIDDNDIWILEKFKWIILGAETGNRPGKVIPQKQWIDNIVKDCDNVGIPVFMKNSLLPIIGETNMRREFPIELSRALDQ